MRVGQHSNDSEKAIAGYQERLQRCVQVSKPTGGAWQVQGVSKPRTLFHILLKTKTRARNITPFNVCKEAETSISFEFETRFSDALAFKPGA